MVKVTVRFLDGLEEARGTPSRGLAGLGDTEQVGCLTLAKNLRGDTVVMKVSASLLLLFVLLLATSCSTPRFAQFSEQDQANLVVRYYTDDTSYVLKPMQKDGPFLSVLKKDAVLNVAKRQPGRDLAVVILIHYAADAEASMVRNKWRNLLTEAGYQRVVFLRANGGMQINGLPLLASGG